jgi:hypothetical protein
MHKLTSFIERFFLLAPDDGADTGSTESTNEGSTSVEDITNTSETVDTEKADTDIENKGDEKTKDTSKNFDLSNVNKHKATFVSQLSKENQEIEFGDNITKIDDLAADWKKLSDGSKNSIKVPNKDASPEEVRTFLDTLGVPESADKYELEQKNLSNDQYTEIKDVFMKEAFNSALSTGQAKNMWNMVNGHFTAQNEMLKEMNNNVKETFEARFDKELESQSNDPAARKEMAEEYANSYKDLIMKNPDCAVFKEFGLNFNPKVIIALAKLSNASGSDKFNSGTTKFNSSSNSSPFGDQFNKTYGK